MASMLAKFLLTLIGPPDHKCGRLIIMGIGFLSLLIGYVLGCFALYYYLLPEIGDVLTLMSLGGFFLITSLLLFFVGWLLKPKKKFLGGIESLHPILESVLRPVVGEKESQKLLSALPNHLPLVALVVGVGVASYLASQAKSQA